MRLLKWIGSTLVLLLAVPGSGLAQKPPKPGKCEDIPVKVTVSAANFGTNRIYGDGVVIDAAGDTVYQDDVDGVYARFQVCNQTNDLIINLNTANSRHLLFNFTVQLAPPDPLAIAPPGTTPLQVRFMNTDQVFDAPLGGPGVVTRQGLMTSSWSINRNVTQNFRFVNPAAYGFDGTGNPDLRALANSPVDTSLINIEHPDCATWIIYPDASTDSRAGLVETSRSAGQTTHVSAGQYSMPYRMKVELLGACPAP